MTKWTTILLSVLGLAVAVYTVATINRDRPPEPPPAAPPSVNPFERGIAGTGIVEAATRNIAVGAPEAGLVARVLVQVGELVRQGQPLLEMDARLLEAEHVRASSAVATAEARLARLVAMPRAEDLPPLRAAVQRAAARLDDARDRLAEMLRAGDKAAATASEISRLRFAVQVSEAELEQSRAELQRAEAGAWDREAAVASAELGQARADVRAIELRLDRLVVRSPIDGTVLKRNVEPGQAVSGPAGNGTQVGAVVVGDLRSLHVRARVDEEDAPLLRSGAAGVARVRGLAGESVPLRMVRIEPLAVPKTDLSGVSTERVDTRVVEVVFELVGASKSPLFPGQLVDVFIETKPGGQGPAGGPGPGGAGG